MITDSVMEVANQDSRPNIVNVRQVASDTEVAEHRQMVAHLTATIDQMSTAEQSLGRAANRENTAQYYRREPR